VTVVYRGLAASANNGLPIWITVLVGILPVLGAFGGAYLQSRRDDKRWIRERDRERERWIREDSQKWLDLKVQTISKFAIVMDNWRNYLLHPEFCIERKEQPYHFATVAHQEVLPLKWLANEATWATASRYLRACTILSALMQMTINSEEELRRELLSLDASWKSALDGAPVGADFADVFGERLRGLHDQFMAAVREEIGTR
jgi:hypothetical protein